MAQLIQNIQGLKLQHQQETPLFEKTYIPPDYGNKLVSRVYADGSLYYLSESGEKWNFISSVSEKGVLGIRATLEKCCNLASLASASANGSGAVIWKIPYKNQIQEIVVRGIPEGENKIFLEIDLLINTNIQTIPPG